MIRGDMRQPQFRGRQIIYGEIRNTGFLPDTVLVLHAERPTNPQGRVVRIAKDTIKRLRRVNAWKRGRILLTLYGDRPDVPGSRL
jgi:hypothetical protein